MASAQLVHMRCKPAMATISLGQPGLHDIRTKLHEAARYGFKAIELFYDDLTALASSMSSDPSQKPSHHDLLRAAELVRDLCCSLQLKVLNLQPLRFYEGLVDRSESSRLKMDVVTTWFDIVQILGADTILIASNFLGPDPETGVSRTVGDVDVIVNDLRYLAVGAAKCSPPIRIAYEALAWGNHVNTWQKAWDIVLQVNCPNFGLALDTFNLAAAEYADPTMESGRVANCEDKALSNLKHSLEHLVTWLDLSRVFIVQIADGERLRSPLQPGHPFYVAEQPPLMSWSRNSRLFVCEEDRGGYLPVLDIVRLLLDMGWDGYLAHEVFSRTLADPSPKTPGLHAFRAWKSWAAMTDRLTERAVAGAVESKITKHTQNATKADMQNAQQGSVDIHVV